jgi:hypothetical protein
LNEIAGDFFEAIGGSKKKASRKRPST